MKMTTVKAQLVQVTAEKLELSTKLCAVAVEADRRLEELAGERDGLDRVKG